tara:strand:+ start:175 stop:759 length:585 start_codon:yes stop_codon:yes gene_type:complete
MLKKIRSLGLNSSFIEIYDNAFSQKECDILIDQFEKSEIVEGHTTTGYRPKEKQCRQINNPYLSDKSIISNIVKPVLMKCLAKYFNKYGDVLQLINRWEIDDGYSFQKYDRDGDGFKTWHCEHGPDNISNKRIMVWMFYLNNAKSGTEFVHHPTIKAKKGRGVIWPAGWTHHHRSVIPNEGLKYIVTGWISYTD